MAGQIKENVSETLKLPTAEVRCFKLSTHLIIFFYVIADQTDFTTKILCVYLGQMSVKVQRGTLICPFHESPNTIFL